MAPKKKDNKKGAPTPKASAAKKTIPAAAAKGG